MRTRCRRLVCHGADTKPNKVRSRLTRTDGEIGADNHETTRSGDSVCRKRLAAMHLRCSSHQQAQTTTELPGDVDQPPCWGRSRCRRKGERSAPLTYILLPSDPGRLPSRSPASASRKSVERKTWHYEIHFEPLSRSP